MLKALEIVISLTGIYLLYSLLGTIIQEFIAQILGLRARMLSKGIARMLDEVKTGIPIRNVFSRPLAYVMQAFPPAAAKKLTNKFYQEPSIRFLGSGSIFSKPSYLSGQVFSSTLIRMLKGHQFEESQPQISLVKNCLEHNLLQFDKDTLRHLRDLFAESSNDMEKFKTAVEAWYNETMERVSGWYKRQSQFILFFSGLVIAILFNVDTIGIANRLSANDDLRAKVVEYAGNLSDSLTMPNSEFYRNFAPYLADSLRSKKDSVNVKAETFKVIYKQADSVNNMLALGWNWKVTSGPMVNTRCNCPSIPQRSVWLAFLGWIITAFAISLGSGFWFDILNKVVRLRSSGLIPAKDSPGLSNK